MAENKTRETEASVEAFIDAVENRTRREDAGLLLDLMARVTGAAPKMWGPSIIGFGKYAYRYDSGHSGEAPRIGFSPRKANLVLYLMMSPEEFDDLRSRLGKHRTSVACLYVNKLADVDMDVLETMIDLCWRAAGEKYGESE